MKKKRVKDGSGKEKTGKKGRKKKWSEKEMEAKMKGSGKEKEVRKGVEGKYRFEI